MSTLVVHRSVTDSHAVVLPQPEPRPRLPINIRPAVAGGRDIQFIDALQKQHTRMVGWFPRQQLENYVKANQVLIAESESGNPVGYCIARDQYFKRDDVGVIYQLNVAPGKRRNLVGAALVKATFERAAYGCKLFCCWCAQDIEANYFWESLGFVPLAFRTGSKSKQRIHIFWQRRVREDDNETPYWFPSETKGGAIREDRLVLPIPPGTHWSDAKPLVLPGMQPGQDNQKSLESPKTRSRPKNPKRVVSNPNSISAGGLWFAPKREPRAEKPKREKPPKQKNDPKYVAAARELRDRWLEQVNADPGMLLGAGKYDVSRQIEAAPTQLKQSPLLDAA